MVQTKRISVLGIGILVLLAGCGGVGDVHTSSTTPPSTSAPEPASAQIIDILEASPRVSDVLVNDTFAYIRGCFDESNDTAVAYFRTDFHYESFSDGNGRRAVGGQLYRARLDLSSNSVASLENTTQVPDKPTC